MFGNCKMMTRVHYVFDECLCSDAIWSRQVRRWFRAMKYLEVVKGVGVDSHSERYLIVDVPCCETYIPRVSWYDEWYCNRCTWGWVDELAGI